MRIRPAWPCALLLLARAAGAQNPPDLGPSVEGVEAPGEADLVRRAAAALRDDPGARERLAARILSSGLAEGVSSSRDAGEARSEALIWIRGHPEDAARLAVGFARDDESHTDAFERSLRTRIKRDYELNPNLYKGLLGVLDFAGRRSQEVLSREKITEESQSEIMKRIFEGAGEAPALGTVRPGSGPAAAYDRISSLNPTGYSADVLAYQNSLNAERVPGAPHVPETGRLDYYTLVHPYYALYSRAALLKKTAVEFFEPASLPEDIRLALDGAEKALADLKAEADKTMDASRITKGRLIALGRKQEGIQRWLTIASLENDLRRLESLRGFWTRNLKDRIAAAPAPPEARAEYLGAGERLYGRILAVREYDRRALDILQKPDYAAGLARVNELLKAAEPLRGNLDADVAAVRSAPERLRAAAPPKSRWETLMDRVRSMLGGSSRP